MNPLVGLQDPRASLPTQGLMGNVYQGSQSALPQMSAPPSLMNYQPGQWSQMAYRMAGSPNQGPFPSVPTPPMPAGITNGTASAGGSSIGGTALGLLGALAKNPALLKSAGNGISSLWSSLTGGAANGSLASIMAGGSPTLAPVGVGAVDTLPSVSAAVDAGAAPAVSPLTSELPATATGTYATPAAAPSAAPTAAGGLMGAGAASSAGSALGAGAPGVFASGNAAAGSAGASAGLGTGATLATVAPFAALAGLALSNGLSAQATNDQGNAAMKAWMTGTGATYKPSAGNTNVGQSTFGNASQFASASHPGNWIGANGQPMTEQQVHDSILAYAKAHGLPTGNFY